MYPFTPGVVDMSGVRKLSKATEDGYEEKDSQGGRDGARGVLGEGGGGFHDRAWQRAERAGGADRRAPGRPPPGGAAPRNAPRRCCSLWRENVND